MYQDTSYETLIRGFLAAQEKVRRLELEQKQNELYTAFGKAVENSSSGMSIFEAARILRANGIDITGNGLFEYLRLAGYLHSTPNGQWNMPTEQAAHLFIVCECPYQTDDGLFVINKTVKLSGQGQVYFIGKFLSLKNQVVENL